MKSLLVTLVLASAIVSPSQDPAQPQMPPPPKELRLLWFTLGEWRGELMMFEPGAKAGTPAKSAIQTGPTLGGMWLESKFESEMGGLPMQGLQMTCYDAPKKRFVAYWFDSMGPGGLELSGKLEGQVLILTSKPTEIPGMPGKHAFRTTTALKGHDKLLHRVEMNSGKGWTKMLEGVLSR